jgi:aconitate hydratase
MTVTLTVHRADGSTESVDLLCRIDTLDEVEYYRNGGILALRPAPTARGLNL